MTSLLRRSGALLSLWLMATVAHANDWYQIELLVLERPSGPVTEKFLPLHQPHYNTVFIVPGSEPQLPEENALAADFNAVRSGAWRFLDSNQHTLTSTRQNLEKNGYQTLLHHAWRQPVRARGQALPLFFEGGPLLSLPTTDISSDTLSDSDQLPAPLARHAFEGGLLLHLDRYVEVEPNFWFLKADQNGQYFWTFINQKRRLRNDEVNYFDHPLYAVLLRATQQ